MPSLLLIRDLPPVPTRRSSSPPGVLAPAWKIRGAGVSSAGNPRIAESRVAYGPPDAATSQVARAGPISRRTCPKRTDCPAANRAAESTQHPRSPRLNRRVLCRPCSPWSPVGPHPSSPKVGGDGKAPAGGEAARADSPKSAGWRDSNGHCPFEADRSRCTYAACNGNDEKRLASDGARRCAAKAEGDAIKLVLRVIWLSCSSCTYWSSPSWHFTASCPIASGRASSSGAFIGVV